MPLPASSSNRRIHYFPSILESVAHPMFFLLLGLICGSLALAAHPYRQQAVLQENGRRRQPHPMAPSFVPAAVLNQQQPTEALADEDDEDGENTTIELVGEPGEGGLSAVKNAVPVAKRLPHPSGWRRQPGRVRSYHHAMEMPTMPEFGGRRFVGGNLRPFYDYAQRPMFVRYMRSFAP